MSDETTVELITKIDATRRQLRTAIRLFCQDGDAVSIHTLASAAQGVLDALLKPNGKGSPWVAHEVWWGRRCHDAVVACPVSDGRASG